MQVHSLNLRHGEKVPVQCRPEQQLDPVEMVPFQKRRQGPPVSLQNVVYIHRVIGDIDQFQQSCRVLSQKLILFVSSLLYSINYR
jgi:hypothetical protein